MTTMTTYDFLTRHIEEVIGAEELKQKITESKTLRVYWGTAPTGPPHVAYLLPLLKIKDCLEHRCNVTVLLADVHSYLDKGFASVNKVEHRTIFYEFILKELLQMIGVVVEDIEFRKGSEYQLDRRYSMDLLKLSTLVSLRDAKRAGTEVVKHSKNPKLSTLIYPLMQCLDETVIEADIEIGGRDQRKIFTMSREYIELLGYKKCSYLITPLIPALTKKGKMSASDENGKIEFTDSDDQIRAKISRAFCADGDVSLETNPCMALLKYIVFPIFSTFKVTREEKWGGDVTYNNFSELEVAWKEKSISGADLKPALAEYIVKIVSPIRVKIEEKRHLMTDAYE
jgi:tyrosyl-tRNA synthetase